MRRFRNILLALDVSDDDVSADDDLPERLRSAVAEATWLAKAGGARLTLHTVVGGEEAPQAREEALRALESVSHGAFSGLDVPVEVDFGTPSDEIIRRVQRDGHDLVIAAARKPSRLDGAIVGGTSLQLLRHCPGAVWITGPELDPGAWCVLTAVGSTGLAPTLLDVSAELVALRGGEWHVLHCSEYREEGGMRLQHVPREEIEAYRKGVREEDWAMLRSLTRGPKERTGVEPQLWLSDELPDGQILKVAEEQDAHLVVMGTLGRAGLPGILIGNVAETVFKKARCSVLAIKPEGFVSPVA